MYVIYKPGCAVLADSPLKGAQFVAGAARFACPLYTPSLTALPIASVSSQPHQLLTNAKVGPFTSSFPERMGLALDGLALCVLGALRDEERVAQGMVFATGEASG